MENLVQKILIVDDSRIFRQNIEKALLQIGDFEIVSSLWNGRKAVDVLKKGILPDLITLDVEMPEMDGIETLKEIQKINNNLTDKKKISVLMISSKTKAGAEITIEALRLGAFDFIFKPNFNSLEKNFTALKEELKKKIDLFQEIKLKGVARLSKIPVLKVKEKSEIRNYEMIAIGISTGGPKLLFELLPELSKITDMPIVIAQHMPEGFTTSLAGHLNKRCSSKVLEASDNMPIEKNHIYIAPGNYHLLVKEKANKVYCSVNQNPVESGYYPSVDYLFRSVASIYEDRLISLIMTGMGRDGTSGLAAVKRKGGYVIAQDEESSIVWGMPKSAIENDLSSIVLDFRNIPEHIKKIIKK